MFPQVTIVIPAYNAFDELQKCMDSLFIHTNMGTTRIVIINDHSPDERIAPYLDSLISKGISIYHNERNYGFSHNVNLGMSLYKDTDVILLNTDTIVTAGWVEKLIRCAYSDTHIGTVTPFSNSATLCSLPHFCQDNSLPEGYTIDEYATVIEQCSMHRYPEIPVAVGFCMYIKREVINSIGFFDEDTFQRGYGEENDFCNRAQLAGYRHVLCDDTFIYHSGSASFISTEKKTLMENHEKIILDRYPRISQELSTFCSVNPLSDLQKNVQFWTALCGNRPSILYVTHRDFRVGAQDSLGGTQLHVQDLKNLFCDQYHIFVLARDSEHLNLTAYIGEQEFLMRFYVGPTHRRPNFHDPSIAHILTRIFDSLPIDLIHVHHTMDISLDVYTLAHKRNIPIFATLHDYYTICPCITMIDPNNHLCTLDVHTDCSACLASGKRFSEKIPSTFDFISRWRKEHVDCLQLCTQLFAPSESTREIFSQFYPQLKDKIVVIPHGSNTSSATTVVKRTTLHYHLDEYTQLDNEYHLSGWVYKEQTNSSEYIPFIFIETVNGAFFSYDAIKVFRPDVAIMHKSDLYNYSGFQVNIPAYAIQLATSVSIGIKNKSTSWIANIKNIVHQHNSQRSKSSFRVAFIGDMCIEKGSKLAYDMIKKSPSNIDWYVFGRIGDPSMHALHQPNLYYCGQYKRDDIAALLTEYEIDLVCLPSRCSETFGYVLSEVLEARIPVIAADIGAIGDRIRKDGLGWLLPYEADGLAFLEIITRLSKSPDELHRIKENINHYSSYSLQQMRNSYNMYYATISASSHTRNMDPTFVLEGIHEAMSGNQTFSNANELATELNTIKNSFGYRLLTKYRQSNFPLKTLLKKMFLWGYRTLRRLQK